MEQSTPNGEEVAVSGIVDLNNAPRVLTCPDLATANVDDVLGADNGKGHQAAQLGVLFDGVLVILFNVVWEVVDRDAVVLNVLHDQLLGLGQLGGRQCVRLANHWNDVDPGG